MTSAPVPPVPVPSVLVVGASRGLGAALAGEFRRRGWAVLATVRDPDVRTPLHDIASATGVEIESVDISDRSSIAALAARLADRTFDVLFVNAGIVRDDDATMGVVADEDFAAVMSTNALGPMRVFEALGPLVPPTGMLGVMSSGQGSIAGNTRGGHELYRGSKAALNMFVRSLAAHPEQARRSIVLMAPGWIRSGVGGEQAPSTVEEAIPDVVDVLVAKRHRPGLEYLDRYGAVVPW